MSKIQESKLVQEALAKLSELQKALGPKIHYELSFEIEKGQALYLGNQGEINRVSFVPMSSYGLRSKTMKWAWANEQLPPPSNHAHLDLDELAQKTGYDIFRKAEKIILSLEECDCLSALIVDHFDGYGMISQQYDDTLWFFLITAVETNLDSHSLSSNTISRALHALFLDDKVDLFNMLREQHPEIQLHFIDADLRGPSEPWKGDLHVQMLAEMDIIRKHKSRVLDNINLANCRFDGSNFQEVSLKNASFKSSVLINVDFRKSDLTNATLENTFLNNANFSETVLTGTRFKGAELGRTLFVGTDLSDVKDLEETRHSTSSEISFSTLVKSGFQVSEKFIRDAGVSIGLIEDLRRGKRIGTKYSTCFLSYSSKDKKFAKEIYYALMEAGVRVYWDSTDLLGGDYLDSQLINAIKEHDRTITVFSNNSIKSQWVLKEVQTAIYYKPEGFTPIRLCDIEPIQAFVKENDVRPDITDSYPILDFSTWKNDDEFKRLINKLLRSITR